MTQRLSDLSVRRPLGGFLASLVLVVALAGCTSAVQTDLSAESVPIPTPEDESIAAATMKDGRDLKFDSPGGRIARDTLFAYVDGSRVAFPMSKVDRVVVERREGDAVASVALVVGLAALVVAAAAILLAAGAPAYGGYLGFE